MFKVGDIVKSKITDRVGFVPKESRQPQRYTFVHWFDDGGTNLCQNDRIEKVPTSV